MGDGHDGDDGALVGYAGGDTEGNPDDGRRLWYVWVIVALLIAGAVFFVAARQARWRHRPQAVLAHDTAADGVDGHVPSLSDLYDDSITIVDVSDGMSTRNPLADTEGARSLAMSIVEGAPGDSEVHKLWVTNPAVETTTSE